MPIWIIENKKKNYLNKENAQTKQSLFKFIIKSLIYLSEMKQQTILLKIIKGPRF